MQDRINFNMNFNLNEIIYYTFRTLKENFFTYFKLFMINLIPTLIIFIYSYNQLFNFKKTYDTIKDPYQSTINLMSFLTLLLFLIIILTLYKLALIDTTKKIIKNEFVAVDKVIFSNLKILFPVFITLLIGNILISIGFIFFIFPALIIGVFLIYIPQISVIDKMFFFKNLKKSFVFGFKSFWYVFLAPIFFYSIFLILVYVINRLFPDKNIDKAFLNKDLLILLVESGILYILYLIAHLLVQIGVTIKFMNVKYMLDNDAIIQKK